MTKHTKGTFNRLIHSNLEQTNGYITKSFGVFDTGSNLYRWQVTHKASGYRINTLECKSLKETLDNLERVEPLVSWNHSDLKSLCAANKCDAQAIADICRNAPNTSKSNHVTREAYSL